MKFASNLSNLASKAQWFLIKIPTSQSLPCHAFHTLNLQWYHLNIHPANSMITQPQELWILYNYVPTHYDYYSSVIFRSLHFYRSGFIIMSSLQVRCCGI